MPRYAVGREDVLSAMRAALEPLDHVQVMWEAGAIALDRVDEWSDIDLQVACDDDRVLVEKELNRGNVIEAAAFYQSYTLRPLIEALRIFHDPTRHDSHTRYVHYAFPESDVKRLTELIFVASGEELAAKRERAEEWFNEVVGAINDGPLSDGKRRAAGRTKGMEDDA